MLQGWQCKFIHVPAAITLDSCLALIPAGRVRVGGHGKVLENDRSDSHHMINYHVLNHVANDDNVKGPGRGAAGRVPTR